VSVGRNRGGEGGVLIGDKRAKPIGGGGGGGGGALNGKEGKGVRKFENEGGFPAPIGKSREAREGGK